MPTNLDEFYEAIRYYDVDDVVTDDSKVQGYLDSVRKFGQNLLDDFRDFCSGKSKLRPPKQNALVRTISETAFLEPKDVTPLDDVTKPELIEYKSKSNILIIHLTVFVIYQYLLLMKIKITIRNSVLESEISLE